MRDVAGSVVRIYGFAQDITEQKRAEAERERLIADLARSNRDLEQFAYIASHDLKTPLRNVSSFVELLARRYKGKLGPEADEYISFAMDGTARMHRLLNDILEYSRIGTQARPLVPTDCQGVLDLVLANLRGQVEESGAEITAGFLPTIPADETQLVQLFANLLGNAIKYRQAGARPRIRVAAERFGKEWLFSVRDNGIGFEQQYAERIFRVFQRLHPESEYPGTGIGLAICKRIVERHGGRIWAESAPGEGSVFFFTMPAEATE